MFPRVMDPFPRAYLLVAVLLGCSSRVSLGDPSDGSAPDVKVDAKKDLALEDAGCKDLSSGCSSLGLLCPPDLTGAKSVPDAWCKDGSSSVTFADAPCGGYDVVRVTFGTGTSALLFYDEKSGVLVAVGYQVRDEVYCSGADDAFVDPSPTCKSKWKFGPNQCPASDAGSDAEVGTDATTDADAYD